MEFYFSAITYILHAYMLINLRKYACLFFIYVWATKVCNFIKEKNPFLTAFKYIYLNMLITKVVHIDVVDVHTYMPQQQYKL